MFKLFMITATALAAGFTIAWVLQSRYARAIRRFPVLTPRCASMNANVIDPLDELRCAFQAIESFSLPADIGEGPLVPEGEGRVERMSATCVEQHAWSGTPPYTPARER
jgi:hypothetical protein